MWLSLLALTINPNNKYSQFELQTNWYDCRKSVCVWIDYFLVYSAGCKVTSPETNSELAVSTWTHEKIIEGSVSDQLEEKKLWKVWSAALGWSSLLASSEPPVSLQWAPLTDCSVFSVFESEPKHKQDSLRFCFFVFLLCFVVWLFSDCFIFTLSFCLQ